MRVLAIEKEIQGVKEEDYEPYLKEEALRVLELYESGNIREIFFERDRHLAVIILECTDEYEASELLHTLPLVKNKLIDFEIHPLIPYTGFSRIKQL